MKAMTLARSVGSGRPGKLILVPGTTARGLASQGSSIVAVQTWPSAFNPGEQLYPARLPAFRPTTPNSVGPMRFWPAAMAWQTAQWEW